MNHTAFEAEIQDAVIDSLLGGFEDFSRTEDGFAFANPEGEGTIKPYGTSEGWIVSLPDGRTGFAVDPIAAINNAVTSDLEAQVFVAERHYRIPGVPEDLELEDTTTIGIYSSEDAALQACAESVAEKWSAALHDEQADWGDLADGEEAVGAMGEYRWIVTAQPVLS